jgi:hypothetical protein
MKNIKKITKQTSVEPEDSEDNQTEARPKDVTYIEGFNPLFQGWNTDQVQLVFDALTGEEDIDEDAITEMVDNFTTELELRTNLKPWRLFQKKFPEGVRYLLQELRLDSAKPYYLTQRIFLGKQKALMALREVRETGELE